MINNFYPQAFKIKYYSFNCKNKEMDVVYKSIGNDKSIFILKYHLYNLNLFIIDFK
jgi:hypothetical protein